MSPRAGQRLGALAVGLAVACGGGSTDGEGETSGGSTGTGTSTETSTTGGDTSDTGSSGGGSSSDTGTTTGTVDDPVPGRCSIDPAAASDAFADCVELFDPSPGVSFGHDLMPDVVLGAPAGGNGGGSLDVASLGCGGSITLALDGPGIPDGPGADLIVFENPFPVGNETFTEPARVGVSEDGVTWSWFPCSVAGDGVWPPTGCAGVTPVSTTPQNGIDPTDPELAGGDVFDLADLGLSVARYVRLVDVTEAHYGDATWCAGESGGFDLDAVAAVHGGG